MEKIEHGLMQKISFNTTGCYSSQAYKEVIRTINVPAINFGIISQEETDRVLNSIKVRIGEHSITPTVYHNIRGNWLKNYIINNSTRIISNARDIACEYERSGILRTSRIYNFPPVALMNNILLFKYGRGYMSRTYTDRDSTEIDIAAQNDAVSVISQPAAAIISAENEKLFVQWLRGFGVSFKTEEDLKAEQLATHGRAMITPDVLFENPVIINGAIVNWIDFKDYTGAPIDFIIRGLKKQAAKYNEKFGAGIFVFSKGFVCSLSRYVPAVCFSMSNVGIDFI